MKKKHCVFFGFAVLLIAAIFTLAGCGDNGDPTSPGGLETGAVVAPPTLDSKTANSITINAVTAPSNGQTVEYAKNTANTAPASGWQDGLTFSSLTASTTYYIFARSKANATYAAGAASAGLSVMTNASGGGDDNFVPVTNITNVPVIALVNASLSLSGTVEPANATNTTITWSGTNVTDGVFTASSTGNSTVTATIVNGASESSLYTQDFTITAYSTDNPITLAQGIWENGELTFEITGNNWVLYGTHSTMGYIYSRGIIVSVGTLTYGAQITGIYDGEDWSPWYSYETGTYSFSGVDNNAFEMQATGYSSGVVNGTWIKQP
jgi:hypothetical protein